MRYKHLRFPNGKPKAVTLSYDDGVFHDIKLAEIAKEYNVKCTFNICSGFISAEDNNRYLSVKEIKEHLILSGNEIAVHGENHRAMGIQTVSEGLADVYNCRKSLEEAFGIIIRGMAYPDTGITSFSNNTTYERVKNYLTDCGIAYSRSLGADNDRFELPGDWHNWIPTAHHYNSKIFEYIDKFNEDFSKKEYPPSRRPMLFYMWGHSYEFANNNDWDTLHKILDKLANKDDVWYATNIEIYDYVKAYNSLVISLNGRIMHNPTNTVVWFEIDGKDYVINPGDTIVIE